MSRSMPLSDLIISLLFPRRCPFCDKPVNPFGALVCEPCIRQAQFVNGATCYKCGKPLDDVTEEYCDDCKRKSHMFDLGMSVFEYKCISDSIYRFKYKGRQEYATFFGKAMAICFLKKMPKQKVDALIPIPIHASKMKSRGYNQAQLLAESMADYLNIPVMNNVVCRARKTLPLKDLTPGERNNILHGAFKLTCNDVKLDTIVLIDDIYTTGATMDVVSSLLRKAGVRKIYCVTLAIGKGV